MLRSLELWFHLLWTLSPWFRQVFSALLLEVHKWGKGIEIELITPHSQYTHEQSSLGQFHPVRLPDDSSTVSGPRNDP